MLRGEAALWVVTCSSFSDPASVIHSQLLKLKHIFVYPTEAQSPHVAVTEGTHTHKNKTKQKITWLVGGLELGPGLQQCWGGHRAARGTLGRNGTEGIPSSTCETAELDFGRLFSSSRHSQLFCCLTPAGRRCLARQHSLQFVSGTPLINLILLTN